jgi:pyruvate dehydrogenase E2 component (dihydrolipoamide acetyltransferase)
MASLISPYLSVPTAAGRARLAAPGAPRRRRMAVVRAKIREIFMPALSSTMTEGKIVSWTAAEGDRVAKGDPVVVVESDKADMDVETFHDGIVAAVLVPAGGTALVGAPIALLAESEEEVALARARAQALSQGQSQEPSPPHAAAAAPGPPPPAPVAPPVTKGIATPYAKKLAKQHRVDIAGVVGTGPHGRVTAADVEAAVGPAPPMPASAVLPPVPGGTVVPFTTMQAAVSRNMVESLSVPTFRVGYSMITDKLDALYEKVQFSIDLTQSVEFHTWIVLV